MTYTLNSRLNPPNYKPQTMSPTSKIQIPNFSFLNPYTRTPDPEAVNL
jgi:hypothetical protein